jgi:hypothetical protein
MNKILEWLNAEFIIKPETLPFDTLESDLESAAKIDRTPETEDIKEKFEASEIGETEVEVKAKTEDEVEDELLESEYVSQIETESFEYEEAVAPEAVMTEDEAEVEVKDEEEAESAGKADPLAPEGGSTHRLTAGGAEEEDEDTPSEADYAVEMVAETFDEENELTRTEVETEAEVEDDLFESEYASQIATDSFEYEKVVAPETEEDAEAEAEEEAEAKAEETIDEEDTLSDVENAAKIVAETLEEHEEVTVKTEEMEAKAEAEVEDDLFESEYASQIETESYEYEEEIVTKDEKLEQDISTTTLFINYLVEKIQEFNQFAGVQLTKNGLQQSFYKFKDYFDVIQDLSIESSPDVYVTISTADWSEKHTLFVAVLLRNLAHTVEREVVGIEFWSPESNNPGYNALLRDAAFFDYFEQATDFIHI